MELKVTLNDNENLYYVDYYSDEHCIEKGDIYIVDQETDFKLRIDADNLFILDRNFIPTKLYDALLEAAAQEYEESYNNKAVSDMEIMKEQHSLTREQMGIK